jgi:hypothetical protein
MQISRHHQPKQPEEQGRRGFAGCSRSWATSVRSARPSLVDSIKPVLREFLQARAVLVARWRRRRPALDGAPAWKCSGPEFRGADVPLTLPPRAAPSTSLRQQRRHQGNAESLLALRSAIGAATVGVEVDSCSSRYARRRGRDGTSRTWGFGVAAGGDRASASSPNATRPPDPNPRTIVKVIEATSWPRCRWRSRRCSVPGMPGVLRDYASEVFAPALQGHIDGMVLPERRLIAVHIASMSINFGNVLRFFNKADTDGVLHALVGSPSPMWLVRNLPKMHRGADFNGRKVVDRACREMIVEATDGGELLAPVIDGEHYRDLKKVVFKVGPRVRIPKLVSEPRN